MNIKRFYYNIMCVYIILNIQNNKYKASKTIFIIDNKTHFMSSFRDKKGKYFLSLLKHDQT